MLDALVLRGMATRTQEAYIDAVARLARHHWRSPDTLTADEVQQYLLHLLRERHLARSSVNQYGCAFRFLYGTVLGLDGQAFQIPLAPAPQRLPRDTGFEQALCADSNGFSLHAAVRCGADERKSLEQLCRYITRPALAAERVQCNAAGQVVLKLKTAWRDGTTHLVMSPLEFMQRLAALVPRPLAGRVGPVARPLARHKQSTGLFVSGLGACT